jgi:hypothetical protein
MNLIICICIGIILYLFYELFYKTLSKKVKEKKILKKKEEENIKRRLFHCHPEFIRMYDEFKLDQEEKRKSGYYSDLMISDGGYTTKIYGKFVFIYDEYFEKCFLKQIDTKYKEIKNKPQELKKVLELIHENGQLSPYFINTVGTRDF